MGYGTWKARIAKVLSGSGHPLVWTVPEALDQTFKEGDLVYRNAGYLTICGADPALILGIAKEDAHNTTAGLHKVQVDVITGQVLVEMCVYHSVAGTNLIAQTDLAKAYGVVVNSNVWHVDKTDTSATRLRVQQFRDAVGKVNGRVWVQFFLANLEVT